MKEALELLKLFTQGIPPNKPARHNFTMGDDGRLALTLFMDGRWQEVYFEEEDLTKPATQVYAEITSLLGAAS